MFLYGLVVVLASVVPLRSRYSVYERTRRVKAGDTEVARDVQREETADDVAGILKVLGALVLVVFILLALTTFGWLFGSFIAVAGVLLYGPLARVPPIHETSQHLYERIERPTLTFITQHHGIFKFFRSVPRDVRDEAYIASREELVHTIEHLPTILSREEQQLIRHGLKFSTITVESVMTPRSVMDVVQQEDLLGPLMLDELHKTGHSRFPVVDGDVDHVVVCSIFITSCSFKIRRLIKHQA